MVLSGLLRRLRGEKPQVQELGEADAEVEKIAMDTVMEAERLPGFGPWNVSAEKLGYNIESGDRRSGRLRFIEVKGRVQGANTITVMRNETLTTLNSLDSFILGTVEGSRGFGSEPRYVRRPSQREPDFGATSVIHKLSDLLARAEVPA